MTPELPASHDHDSTGAEGRAARRAGAAITVITATVALLAVNAAHAQQPTGVWPTRPVTIVVAYPPGGDTDVLARLYADKLATRLAQQFVVENRPGASGMIGAASVAKAPPDGHTLLFAPSTFAIAQHVLKATPNIAHDVVGDFTPVIKAGNIPLLIVTAPGSGIKDAAQMIADAKAGKSLSYGSPGAGSPMHIAAEMLNREAGIRMAHVPYKGVAPVLNDTVGGHVTVGWITPGAVGGYLTSGKLVPLATAERQRTALLPNVPTLIELGYKGLDVSAWMALLGPKGLAPEVVRALNANMNDVLKLPDVAARMTALGVEPIGGEPAILGRQVADDERRFGALVREFGITAQ